MSRTFSAKAYISGDNKRQEKRPDMFSHGPDPTGTWKKSSFQGWVAPTPRNTIERRFTRQGIHSQNT
jgi:hypothetical protein